MRQGGVPHLRGAEQPVPTIVFHGDRETTVHPVNGEQVIAQSKAGSELQTTVSRGQAPGGISYTRTAATTADTRCSSIGFFTGRVMPGPAEVRPGPTPSRRDPMPAAR
jgi:hypothetical protein